MPCARVVIAGTHSGVGKTSLALALVHALTRRGVRVQAFKVGPDFLDPSYLALASKRPCYNLDGWMTSHEYVVRLFAKATADADVAIVEGVMGLFDGADPRTNEGSTAEIARWLDAPVLLAVNAHGAARSLAATVKGFCEFEPALQVAGIIANHAGSARHAQWLSDSLNSAGLPKLVAAIPRGAFPSLPSRHLGLVTADRDNLTAGVLDALADALEKHVPLDEITQLAASAPPLLRPAGTEAAARAPESPQRVKVGVAHDKAFHFYYPDNLEALEAHGCELVRFSPLADRRLPSDLNALYLGGGYPEEHAAALAGNKGMLADIRDFAAGGLPVYAECGGLMYLAEGLHTLDGRRHTLAGVLPVWTRMLPRRKALGYVEVTLTEDALWGARGATLRGHEFHYSELLGEPPDAAPWRKAFALTYRRAEDVAKEGFQNGSILATYVHAHFASRPDAVRSFVAHCGAAS
ncbi:MAG: cobyrinate a,c-diamide synthase [Planctomycetota bacterium]|nr:cobyrinate a,c-diamide synthase [Planctomycetota bacterium]